MFLIVIVNINQYNESFYLCEVIHIIGFKFEQRKKVIKDQSETIILLHKSKVKLLISSNSSYAITLNLLL